MSEPTPENPPQVKRNVGGFQSHKPGCRCYPCKARRRKEEAESGGTGSEDKEALNADDPTTTLVTTPPKGTKLAPRQHIANWIALRAENPNITISQAAEKLGLGRQYLGGLISKAVNEGWLKFTDPLEKVEHELTPLAIKNLKEFLKDGDKATTLEFARGIIYPAYKDAHQISDNKQSVLAIKIEFPRREDGEIVQGTKIISGGNIVGRPNIFDGDAVEVISSLAKQTETN